MIEPTYVTREECEKHRKESAEACKECREKIEKEHELNIKQSFEIESINKTLSGVKRVAWWIAGLVAGTLVTSLLNIILK